MVAREFEKTRGNWIVCKGFSSLILASVLQSNGVEAYIFTLWQGTVSTLERGANGR